jgi:hypothetical protein
VGINMKESPYMTLREVPSYFISASLIISRSMVSAHGFGSESGELSRDFLLLP